MIRPTTALLALILAASAHGQTAEDKGGTISFRVTRFDPADRAPPEFRIGNGEKQVAVKIPMTYIEGPIKATLRDDKFLDFWRGSAEKPELSIAIDPAKSKDLLLVFIPDKETFRILTIQAPLSKFKGGDRYIVNATPTDIAIKLGDAAPLLIASQKSGILAGPGGKKLQSLPVLIKQKSGEAWSLVSTENWNCDPRFRKYLFIYTSPRTRHIAFHGVSERL